MPDKEWEEHLELAHRSCDALVLAYSSDQAIYKDFREGFYIPSSDYIEEAFGYSLRKVFGQKDIAVHWADSVRWSNVLHLERLEPRILKGTRDVIAGEPDYQTYFEGWFSNFSGRFEQIWIFGRGSLYRFIKGKRDEAFQNFKGYWNKQEKERWNQLHEFMREYTKKQFEKKNS